MKFLQQMFQYLIVSNRNNSEESSEEEKEFNNIELTDQNQILIIMKML